MRRVDVSSIDSSIVWVERIDLTRAQSRKSGCIIYLDNLLKFVFLKSTAGPI